MDLEKILEQYAEWRVVVDTHDTLIQDIASTKISLEKFLPAELTSSTERHLEYQQKTLQNLLSYLQKDLEIGVSALRTKVRNLRVILDSYDHALNESSTMQQAYTILNRSGHFSTEETDFSKTEYEEEIKRLKDNIENVYEYLVDFVSIKE